MTANDEMAVEKMLMKYFLSRSPRVHTISTLLNACIPRSMVLFRFDLVYSLVFIFVSILKFVADLYLSAELNEFYCCSI